MHLYHTSVTDLLIYYRKGLLFVKPAVQTSDVQNCRAQGHTDPSHHSIQLYCNGLCNNNAHHLYRIAEQRPCLNFLVLNLFFKAFIYFLTLRWHGWLQCAVLLCSQYHGCWCQRKAPWYQQWWYRSNYLGILLIWHQMGQHIKINMAYFNSRILITHLLAIFQYIMRS